MGTVSRSFQDGTVSVSIFFQNPAKAAHACMISASLLSAPQKRGAVKNGSMGKERMWSIHNEEVLDNQDAGKPHREVSSVFPMAVP